MLGAACGECEIVVGSDCVPCPHGSDFPECSGCVNGARAERTDFTKDIGVPIVVGVLTTLAIALITSKLLK